MSSAEDKLREYVDGLDKLEDRLSGIRESVKQLSCYKNVTDAAGRGLNDIEVLKAQTVDLKGKSSYKGPISSINPIRRFRIRQY